ncbi:MAG: sodium:calcium antiporter [Promethearchaeota archaeon]
MWNLAFWTGIFILGYLIIFFSADIFLDNLKELCIMYNISPFIVGLLILGIDPEESIASIVAAANGLPYIAIGNVIGNSIIALTLCFAIPAFFYKIEVESIPQFYFIIIYTSMIFILIGFLIYLGLFIFGILALILYFLYLFRNLRHFSKEGITHIIIDEENKEKVKFARFQSKKSSKMKKIVLVIISFIFIIIGGELLIIATKELIIITQIPEAFFGFIIIAFVTNVEELTLVFKSIKKQIIKIGFGGMIGKLIWNLTITFGISGVIASNINFTWILIWNWFILFGIIIYFNIISKKKFIGKKDGIILMLFFITFLIVNLLTFGLTYKN